MPIATVPAVSGAHGGLPGSRGGDVTVLLVDDNDEVRTVVRMLLERAGFDVLEAVNGSEAIAVFEDRADAISLLVTDMSMPGMSGRELADVLRSREAAIRVLFTSGFPDSRADGADSTGEAYLMKPFTHDELVSAARALLAEAPAACESP